MANCCSPVIFLTLYISTMAYAQRQFKVDPTSALFTEVFMSPPDGAYRFNASAASSECRRLGATLATEEQMEEALQRGLQTCKFGWIQGPVAVIPRKEADPKCGNSKLGLVSWRASTDKPFGAFCFKDMPTTTAVPVTFRRMTSAPRRPSVRTSASTKVARYVSRPPPITKPRWRPAGRPAPQTTQRWSWVSSSSSASSPSSPVTSSTSTLPLRSTSPAAPPRTLTSRTSVRKLRSTAATPVQASSLSRFALRPSTSSSTSTSSTPTTASTSSTSTIPKGPTENFMTPHSSKASMGAGPVALAVVGLIVLVLTTAVASWYYKLPRCLFPPPWSRPQPASAGVETEMSKPTHSDTDLQTQLTDEEMTNGKNACEVPLCISQSDTSTNAEV